MARNVLFCAFVAACGVASAAISFEEEILAFRPGVDAYRVFGASGEWMGGRFAVSVTNRSGFYMDYARYPGMKPFRGAEEIVIATDSDGLSKATAELVVKEFPSGKRLQFVAPLVDKTRFRTDLDPARLYQLGSIGVHNVQNKGKPWEIAFTSLRGVFKTTKADALRVEAETGNPLHIVREGKREKPMLHIRNATTERIVAHGVLNVKGFHGDTFDLPVDVALGGGQMAEIPIDGATAKGVWKIGGELNVDDGSVAKVDTRFAVMDFHGITPKQPRGTFRLGVHWHLQRFTPNDRRLAAEAMVACGAKLTRADIAQMASIQANGPGCWDFARTDELMEILESNGLSVDAIIFNIPKWAAKPESQTSPDWREWALGRPTTGVFEKFCERLAARYGMRIDYYEIGNEWDLSAFYRGTTEEAVEILREAHAGLKRGCSSCCVSTCGWTTARDTQDAVKNGRRGIHEYVLRNARGCFDVHAIHSHGAFTSYEDSIENEFFPLRKRTRVDDKPWFSNETALTSLWSERNAALAVWKKILWAWVNGSVDYVWYNLKGTGWNPKDAEQGYGLITADFRPRDSYVAFAALATVVGGAEFKRTILDDGGMHVYEFAKKGSTVITAWTEHGGEVEMSVKTDAVRAWKVDIMGNRGRIRQKSCKVAFRVSSEPCAIVLKHPTFTRLEENSMRNIQKAEDAVIAIPPDAPGRAPDFAMEKPEQVHDFFEANPAEVMRLWSGPKDNSGKVWLSKDSGGLRIRVEVHDDVHSQPYCGAEQYMGDGVQIALAAPGQGRQWEYGFAHCDDGRAEVHCWMAPDGFDENRSATKIALETSRRGKTTRYDAFIPYGKEVGFSEKTLEDGFHFNLMVNDNDGNGRDATIEIVPNTFHSKDMLLAPIVRFSANDKCL